MTKMRSQSTKTLLFSVTRDDCDWQTFTVGGHGGAGKDTSNSGVRCVHRASGATGVGQDHRQQSKNRQDAFRRMTESATFKAWHKLESARRLGKLPKKSVDEIVEEMMHPSNLKIEEL